MNSTNSLSLLTDFYELTMMQGYFFTQKDEKGVFEMFYRKQPFAGGYGVFAGLAPFLAELEKLRFSEDDIKYLRSLGMFMEEFLEYLISFKFRGDIFSMKEGTLSFPHEPLVRIHGSIMEAQLIESLVLNFINYQTLVATKTSRIANAAGRASVLEFGLRRAHGINGALSASRAAVIGGASSTSNTLAGKLYNIPVSGTMAHSWVMSFPSEIESFERYAELYPDKCTLLVDTFDTLKSGVPNAIQVFKKIARKKHSLLAIRIDSGDFEHLSRKAREMLDKNDCADVKIVVSSDLDEFLIEQLKIKGAPVDYWGVGTRLVTGGNDPALTGVYKLVEKTYLNESEDTMKISDEKEKFTIPGIKNVMRFYGSSGLMIADLIFLEQEKEDLIYETQKKAPIRCNSLFKDNEGFILDNYEGIEILLHAVMEKGNILSPALPLSEIQEYCDRGMQSLPPENKRLMDSRNYKVGLSDRLQNKKASLMSVIQSHYKV